MLTLISALARANKAIPLTGHYHAPGEYTKYMQPRTRVIPGAMVIGYINLHAYYNRQSRGDVSRRCAVANEGEIRGTCLNTHPSWQHWIKNQPTSGPAPVLPQRVTLADVVGDGWNASSEEVPEVQTAKPRMSDVVKGEGGGWVVNGITFTSRDKARAWVKEQQ